MIFSVTRERMGFAIITHDPPPEISIACHDRCPVILTNQGVETWLSDTEKSTEDYFEILDNMQKVRFTHGLEPAVAI